jgi:hypothetical protein
LSAAQLQPISRRRRSRATECYCKYRRRRSTTIRIAIRSETVIPRCAVTTQLQPMMIAPLHGRRRFAAVSAADDRGARFRRFDYDAGRSSPFRSWHQQNRQAAIAAARARFLSIVNTNRLFTAYCSRASIMRLPFRRSLLR